MTDDHWHVACWVQGSLKILRQIVLGVGGIEMDFAIVLVVSNSLMAAVIYLVVNWIWED